jgi:hypothetical protein
MGTHMAKAINQATPNIVEGMERLFFSGIIHFA